MSTSTQTKQLPVLTLRNLILFPGVVMPIDVGRAGSLKLIEEAVRRFPPHLGIATQRDPQVDEPGPEDLFAMGVEAEILKVVKLSESRITIVVRGLERRRFTHFSQVSPYLIADAGDAVETNLANTEVEGLGMSVRDAAKQVIELSPEIPDEVAQTLEGLRDASRIADIAGAHLDLSTEDRAAILEELDVKARLERVLGHLQHRLEVYKVKDRIDTQVREEFSRHQREAVLRQKLKAIQEELGEGDDGVELGELEEKIKAAGMPADVDTVARKQLARLKGMPAASAEYTVAHTYLEWLVELPWSKRIPDDDGAALQLSEARRILDADHYDLEKVKRRILEYLAVRKLAPKQKAPILCLVGPPGVGKTSLGKSIAHALGRQFIRISLGGVRDEAEIRGHRRTYIGALPGRIIQGIRRAGSKNPVMMLDELDKLGSDFRGDPSSALLEVLDPEQNNSFSDHYLEVPFDLSGVIFLATANELDQVPAALRDRLEVITIPGYTRGEKLHIAKRFLLPKQLSEHGLTTDHVTLTDGAVSEVIDHHTREAGVRNLEREIASVIRGVAVKVASGESFVTTVGAEGIEAFLGPEKFFSDVAERTEEPGVATGLAWTPTGGDILFIEATRMPGKGNLVLTGQLGSVMKESAQAAFSYIRSRATALGLAADFFDKIDLHLHVPAGGIPKDGPSAGCAIFSAMFSLLSGRRVRGNVAMTGEITLRGSVLAVGGIKEKVLGAHRAGIKRVVLPERNRKDLIDVPAEVQAEVEFCFVRRIEEVIDLAIEKKPALEMPLPPLDLAATALPA